MPLENSEPQSHQPQSYQRQTRLAQLSLVPLIMGVVACSVLVSLAAGKLETVKLAYGFLVIMSGASIIMSFLGLHAGPKFWRRLAIGCLVAGIVTLVFAVRMLSLAYTFQMNLD